MDWIEVLRIGAEALLLLATIWCLWGWRNARRLARAEFALELLRELEGDD